MQCNFFDLEDMKVIYRKFASLCFIIGASKDVNELEIYEFINVFVETLDEYFHNVVNSLHPNFLASANKIFPLI